MPLFNFFGVGLELFQLFLCVVDDILESGHEAVAGLTRTCYFCHRRRGLGNQTDKLLRLRFDVLCVNLLNLHRLAQFFDFRVKLGIFGVHLLQDELDHGRVSVVFHARELAKDSQIKAISLPFLRVSTIQDVSDRKSVRNESQESWVLLDLLVSLHNTVVENLGDFTFFLPLRLKAGNFQARKHRIKLGQLNHVSFTLLPLFVLTWRIRK